MFNRIKRSFKRAVVRTMRARQERAATELAHYLKTYNSDFRTFSQVDLTRAIMSKKPINWSEISR
jgi:hypothetical protein